MIIFFLPKINATIFDSVDLCRFSRFLTNGGGGWGDHYLWWTMHIVSSFPFLAHYLSDNIICTQISAKCQCITFNHAMVYACYRLYPSASYSECTNVRITQRMLNHTRIRFTFVAFSPVSKSFLNSAVGFNSGVGVSAKEDFLDFFQQSTFIFSLCSPLGTSYCSGFRELYQRCFNTVWASSFLSTENPRGGGVS